MRQCGTQLLLVFGVWVACITTENGYIQGVPDADGQGAVSLADVTPQIPDGPVVQAYQRLIEKKKLAAEVERQKKLMGPVMKRGDEKQKAKKNEMEMLAEVEIKNRMGKKELALKRKDKLDTQAERARFQAANARRLERYEKWSQSEVIRNHERLQKLHSHTSGAFKMAKKLFKRKKSTKKTAIESMAKAKAAQKQELRVGGYLELKGDQINFPELVGLNDKIAKAMADPIDANIAMAQKAYDVAAREVAKEQEGFERKEAAWKEKDKKIKDEKEQKQIERHNKKLDELAQKVAKEKRSKKNRKSRIEQDRAANELTEKGKWKKAFDDVKKQRADVAAAEVKAKKDYYAKIEEGDSEKKMKAPGKAVIAKTTKYKERSEKYASERNGDASAAFTAKQMKVRACEELAHAKMQLAKFNANKGLRLGESVREPPVTVESAQKAGDKCKHM